MTDQQTKTRTEYTYVAVIGWTAALISMALVVPVFHSMHVESECWKIRPPPFTLRVLYATPRYVWILLGLVVGEALHWKSKLVSVKTAKLIDTISIVALGVFVGLALVEGLIPLIVITHTFPAR